MILYHATHRKNLDVIMALGLKADRYGKIHGRMDYPAPENAVYLSSRACSECLNAKLFDGKNEVIVLKIDASKLDVDKFFPDDSIGYVIDDNYLEDVETDEGLREAAQSFSYDLGITNQEDLVHSLLKQLMEAGEADYTKILKPLWSAYLQKERVVSYTGDVPPEAILSWKPYAAAERDAYWEDMASDLEKHFADDSERLFYFDNGIELGEIPSREKHKYANSEVFSTKRGLTANRKAELSAELAEAVFQDEVETIFQSLSDLALSHDIPKILRQVRLHNQLFVRKEGDLKRYLLGLECLLSCLLTTPNVKEDVVIKHLYDDTEEMSNLVRQSCATILLSYMCKMQPKNAEAILTACPVARILMGDMEAYALVDPYEGIDQDSLGTILDIYELAQSYDVTLPMTFSQELWDKISESNLEDKYIAIGYPEAHTKTLAL